jgi:hypothetical protein
MTREGAYRLIDACYSSLEEAEALLQAHPSLLNERTGLGETPLHYLAVEDKVDTVQFLHNHGASLNVRNDFGETPLSEALSLGNKSVTEYLLNHGVDAHTSDDRGETTLHAAIRGGDLMFVKRLTAAGIALTACDNMKETPLHRAVERDALDIVEFLVVAGADVNARALFGETPLHMAAEKGLTEIARFLVQHGADPTVTQAQGATPADEAANHGFTELADELRAPARPGPQLKGRTTLAVTVLELYRLSSEAHDAVRSENLAYSAVDAQKQFQFTGLTPGYYEVMATTIISINHAKSIQEIFQRCEVKIEMENCAVFGDGLGILTFSGKVTDPEGHEPDPYISLGNSALDYIALGYIALSLRPAFAWDYTEFIQYAMKASGGEFMFWGLKPGSYELIASNDEQTKKQFLGMIQLNADLKQDFIVNFS